MWKIRMTQVPDDLNINVYYKDSMGLKAIVPEARNSKPGQFIRLIFL